MSKHKREISTEILVGLFMFIVLIALSIFTIVLSSESIFNPTHSYEFVFREVNGLREGDNVYLRGMNIGRVKQTSLEERHIRVYVSLDVPLSLHHGYRIDVVDASMLGGKYLKIYEGPADAPMLGKNVTILGATPVDMVAELAAAVNGLRSMINAVSEGQGALGKLMNDDTLYENILVMSEDSRKILAQISQGEGALGKLLTDAAVYDDTRALMANMRALSERLAAGEGTLGKLMAEDSAVYDDLGATLASIRSISESISTGEGTLGKLVRDAQLYNETTLLVEDVRAAVDDLREASPITSFGSVVFGAF